MKRRAWTEDDINYLKKWWGAHSTASICSHLGRSRNSLRNKVNQLGLGTIVNAADGLTVHDAAYIVGKDYRTVIQWTRNNGLRVRHIGPRIIIGEKTFIDFIRQNPHLWDARNAYKEFFMDADWFMDKLKKDRSTGFSDCKYKYWTGYEEQQLTLMFKRGMSIDDMAEKLNRSHKSVARKIDALGIRKEKKHMWTEEEDAKLLEYYQLGYTADEMSFMLGLSIGSIRNRKYLLGKKEAKCE